MIISKVGVQGKAGGGGVFGFSPFPHSSEEAQREGYSPWDPPNDLYGAFCFTSISIHFLHEFR